MLRPVPGFRNAAHSCALSDEAQVTPNIRPVPVCGSRHHGTRRNSNAYDVILSAVVGEAPLASFVSSGFSLPKSDPDAVL